MECVWPFLGSVVPFPLPQAQEQLPLSKDLSKGFSLRLKQISQEAGLESFLRGCRGSRAACVCKAAFGREELALALGGCETCSKHRDCWVGACISLPLAELPKTFLAHSLASHEGAG